MIATCQLARTGGHRIRLIVCSHPLPGRLRGMARWLCHPFFVSIHSRFFRDIQIRCCHFYCHGAACPCPCEAERPGEGDENRAVFFVCTKRPFCVARSFLTHLANGVKPLEAYVKKVFSRRSFIRQIAILGVRLTHGCCCLKRDGVPVQVA